MINKQDKEILNKIKTKIEYCSHYLWKNESRIQSFINKYNDLRMEVHGEVRSDCSMDDESFGNEFIMNYLYYYCDYKELEIAINSLSNKNIAKDLLAKISFMSEVQYNQVFDFVEGLDGVLEDIEDYLN